MSRPIKFRAWDSVNHKIVTSGLAINLDTTGRVIPVSFSQGDLSYCRDNDVNKVPNVANEIQIMQYTGLKDKNGVEIYEGDVIKGDWSIEDDIEVGEVKFYGGAFRFKPVGLPLAFGYYLKECEVIGNIYENPELLEANQ